MVSSLEQIAVGPSHYKITMVTITSGISICKSKFDIREFGCLEEELKENGEESFRVRFRAHSRVISTTHWVRHVTLVIGSVKVYPIPTRWEENLSSDRVTMMGRERVEIAARASAKANHLNSYVRQIAAVVGASRWVTGNHPEAIGKSQRNGSGIAVLTTRNVVASSKQIVDRRTAEGNQFPHSIRCLVVQSGNPVVAVVYCLVASGSSGVLSIGWSHGALEGISADYGVYVGAGNTRIDDGIGALKSQRIAVHSKDSIARNART